MANNDSEVGSGERVRGVPVLTDDGGGVARLAAVLTAPVNAGHLADSWCEDHFDPAGLISHIKWVVSYRKWDRPVEGGSDSMHLCLSVVVLLLNHEFLAFALVH